MRFAQRAFALLVPEAYPLRGIAQTIQFCTEKAINFAQIQAATSTFNRIKLEDNAVEAILINDESKQRHLALTRNVTKLYKSILPDPSAGEFN